MLIDQVIPLFLSTIHPLALHASGIVVGGCAIAFAGPSGTGKSSLAAAFSRRRVAPVISDDCLLLTRSGGKIAVLPSYPGLRLWSDSVEALLGLRELPAATGFQHKMQYTRRNGLLAEFSGSYALARVFVLEDRPGPITISPMRGMEAVLAMLKCTYLLDPTDPVLLKQQFAAASELLNANIVFKLSFPRHYSMIDAVVDKVVKHAAGVADDRN